MQIPLAVDGAGEILTDDRLIGIRGAAKILADKALSNTLPMRLELIESLIDELLLRRAVAAAAPRRQD